jgi:predicted amidohydrolase
LICEDLWHPSLTYLAGLQGADVVVAIAAAPGRGAGEGSGFRSMETWERMASALALFHQLWVVVVNRSGAEGGITFAGGSFAIAPDGTLRARAGHAPETLSIDLDPGEVAHARRFGAHLRDEDGTLLLRELERIVRPDRDA